MGMSASQARLLSITSRLTNNEFRAQTITNSKLRLATESHEASQAYMDALTSKNLMFMTYDDTGAATKTALTPAFISTYEPLKNQYILVNPAGKVLVSHIDAENFKNSDTLEEFLSCYGILDYKNETDMNLYEVFKGILGTKDNPQSCYSSALGKDTGHTTLERQSECYLHVLNALLDSTEDIWTKNTSSDGSDYYTRSSMNYTTTTGVTFDAAPTDHNGQGGIGFDKIKELMVISEALNKKEDGEYVYLCDGYDDLDNKTVPNSLVGKDYDELDLLMSDYKIGMDGKYKIKSLKEKAIDMYYVVLNHFLADEDNDENKNKLHQMLINFTDGDMTNAGHSFVINDKEKAQWYTNLWYKMNGSDSANLVKSSLNKNGMAEYTIDNVQFIFKNSLRSNFEEFDGNLYTSSEWLEFALEHGMVTMEQAQYFNPSEDSFKVGGMTSEGIMWNSITYTNAPDIVTVDDEKAIAIAEVKYKKRITEIENQDKKFDQDLKKLDTEHNALQTEYDAVKEVITKNTERSFKAFS